ncbi:MAG: transposase [Pirellulales bacterium]
MPWQGTHNNLAERTLRPAAIGRKNWLFVGNDQAAAQPRCSSP